MTPDHQVTYSLSTLYVIQVTNLKLGAVQPNCPLTIGKSSAELQDRVKFHGCVANLRIWNSGLWPRPLSALSFPLHAHTKGAAWRQRATEWEGHGGMSSSAHPLTTRPQSKGGQ